MHFSSATPTGGILARMARRARTVPAVSTASRPLPSAPTAAPAPTLVLVRGSSTPAREGAPQRGAGAPSRSRPPTPGRRQRTPSTVRAAQLSFQRQATFTRASPPARPPKFIHSPQARFPSPCEGSRKGPPTLPLWFFFKAVALVREPLPFVTFHPAHYPRKPESSVEPTCGLCKKPLPQLGESGV